jgi:hypothetical protein
MIATVKASKQKNEEQLPYRRCTFCEPYKIDNKHIGKIAKWKEYTNPAACSYTHVEIDGKVYERSKDKMVGIKSEPCMDCGALPGRYHHVECLSELCPIDDKQFVICGHDQNVRYFKAFPNLEEYVYHPGHMVLHPSKSHWYDTRTGKWTSSNLDYKVSLKVEEEDFK